MKKWIEKLFGKSYFRKAYKEQTKRLDEFAENEKDGRERPELERGDFPAMLLAALITFGPAVLLVAVILFGSLWLFGRAW